MRLYPGLRHGASNREPCSSGLGLPKLKPSAIQNRRASGSEQHQYEQAKNAKA